MSKLLGTLRKKGKKGTYYYRVQIASGERTYIPPLFQVFSVNINQHFRENNRCGGQKNGIKIESSQYEI